MGFATGQVIGLPAADPSGTELRIEFDFDGVLADDSSERVMQTDDLSAFHTNGTERLEEPLLEGKLSEFLRGIDRIQDIEEALIEAQPGYNRRVHVAIVTARNAPSHERLIRTLQSRGEP